MIHFEPGVSTFDKKMNSILQFTKHFMNDTVSCLMLSCLTIHKENFLDVRERMAPSPRLRGVSCHSKLGQKTMKCAVSTLTFR